MSTLDEGGRPNIVERALIRPPVGQIGPISPEVRQGLMRQSLVQGVYEKEVDRESAYEILKGRAEQAATESAKASQRRDTARATSGSRRQGVVEAFVKSTARSVGSQLGRQIMRGILGSLLGGRR